jgi:hypothetical protein
MSQFTTANYSVGPAAPAPAQAGDMWYNTTNGSTLQFNGSAWNGVMYEYIQDVQNQVAAATYAVSHTVFVAPNTSETWQVKAVSCVLGTVSTSGTLQVEVATGTQAVASGTNQLSATIGLATASGAVANTSQNGALIAAPTAIAAGNRINLIFAGTVTGLAGFCVTITLVKLT